MMNGRFGVAARWPGLHRAREMVNKFSVPRGKHMSSPPPHKRYYLTCTNKRNQRWMLKAVIPVKSQDILAIFQNQASFGTQNPSSERDQVARKTQILTVMSFWSFPKRARAIYLGNSTLRKGEDPNILRTVGHRVQADVNTQSPGIASWYPV